MKIYFKSAVTLIATFIIVHCPNFAFASGGDIIWALMLGGVVILPYYALAAIPFILHLRNNGKSFFLSILIYSFCIGGIILADFHFFKGNLPPLRFNNGLIAFFYLSILPFVILIILALNADFRKKEEY